MLDNLLGFFTKNINIVIADQLVDLHIGSIGGSECNCTV